MSKLADYRRVLFANLEDDAELSPEELQAREDEETFSYENSLKYTKFEIGRGLSVVNGVEIAPCDMAFDAARIEMKRRVNEAYGRFDEISTGIVGYTSIDRCDPTIYMDASDPETVRAFLDKVRSAKVMPDSSIRWNAEREVTTADLGSVSKKPKQATTVISPGVEVTITDARPTSKWQEIKESLKAAPGARTMEWVETCSAKVTTLVDRGIAISSDGTRTYIDLETGSLPGTVAAKTAMQNTTVIDGGGKPVWWTTDEGERVGYFAPYIPLTVTRAWADDKMEAPRVSVLPDSDSLYASIRETGFYCPDVPLTSCGPVVDPETFEPVTYDRWGYAMDNKAPTVEMKDTMDAAQFKAFGEAVQRGVEKTPPMPEFKIIKTKVEPKEINLVPGVNITQETHNRLKAILPLECAKIEVEPPTRRFSDKWTVEIAQDVMAEWDLDVESEILTALQEAIADEVEALKGSTHALSTAEEIFVTKMGEERARYIKRRVMPSIIAEDIVGVSPMCAPKMPIAELRARYENPRPEAPTIGFMTRYGLHTLTGDPNVKAMFTPEGAGAARADHVHPEPPAPLVYVAGLDLGPKLTASDIVKTKPEVVLTASNAPVHPLQCKNRSQREKSSIELRAVSFR